MGDRINAHLFTHPDFSKCAAAKKADIQPGEGIVALERALTGNKAGRVLNAWTRLPRVSAIKDLERAELNALHASGDLLSAKTQKEIENRCEEAAQNAACAIFDEGKVGLWWDFGFAGAYAFLLAILCLWAARGFVHLPVFFSEQLHVALFQMAPAVGVAALFAGLMDWGENLFLLRLLSRAKKVASETDGRMEDQWVKEKSVENKHPLGWLPTWATAFSCVKWLLILVALVYMVMGGLTAFNQTFAATVAAVADDNGLKDKPENGSSANAEK